MLVFFSGRHKAESVSLRKPELENLNALGKELPSSSFEDSFWFSLILAHSFRGRRTASPTSSKTNKATLTNSHSSLPAQSYFKPPHLKPSPLILAEDQRGSLLNHSIRKYSFAVTRVLQYGSDIFAFYSYSFLGSTLYHIMGKRGYDPLKGVSWTATTESKGMKKLVDEREAIFAKQRSHATDSK